MRLDLEISIGWAKKNTQKKSMITTFQWHRVLVARSCMWIVSMQAFYSLPRFVCVCVFAVADNIMYCIAGKTFTCFSICCNQTSERWKLFYLRLPRSAFGARKTNATHTYNSSSVHFFFGNSIYYQIPGENIIIVWKMYISSRKFVPHSQIQSLSSLSLFWCWKLTNEIQQENGKRKMKYKYPHTRCQAKWKPVPQSERE